MVSETGYIIYSIVLSAVPVDSYRVVYAGYQQGSWWDNIKGAPYAGKIHFGYNYALPGGFVSFGTGYTVQIGMTLSGVFKYRIWMSDNNAWVGNM